VEACAVEAGLDGFGLDVERLGHVFDWELEHFLQYDGDAELIGELGDCEVDGLGCFGAGCVVGWGVNGGDR
jgi:hypothetical protein